MIEATHYDYAAKYDKTLSAVKRTHYNGSGLHYMGTVKSSCDPLPTAFECDEKGRVVKTYYRYTTLLTKDCG